jgi:hypothetical protein
MLWLHYFCSLLACCILTLPVLGQSCGSPPAIYFEQFQVDRQVDANRNVESATMSNTTEGQYFLEFMAMGDNTRERWTIAYENDSAYEFIQHVSVNGEWRYSIRYAADTNNPRMMISIPGLSAEIDILNPSTDSDLSLFQALAIQTNADRAIVGEVITSLPDGLTQSENPNCLQQYPYPHGCHDSNANCQTQTSCCIVRALRGYCYDQLLCTDPMSCEECHSSAFQKFATRVEKCAVAGVACLALISP